MASPYSYTAQFLPDSAWTSSKAFLEPWLVWLSGLSTGLQLKVSLFDSQSGHMPGL